MKKFLKIFLIFVITALMPVCVGAAPSTGAVVETTDEVVFDNETSYAVALEDLEIYGQELPQVSHGFRHMAALKANGDVFAWGENYYGQVGNGSNSSTCGTPVKVLDNAKNISMGAFHSAAVKADGSLWMWGTMYSDTGTINSGTGGKVYTPSKMMDDVAFVSCGAFTTAFIKNDGSLWTFGYNGHGQLGTGDTTDVSLIKNAVKIMDDVVYVDSYGWHMAAIKKDGSLWVWGDNAEGQLGDGTTNASFAPKKIMDNVIDVSVGQYCTAAVTEDGTLWFWGRRYYDYKLFSYRYDNVLVPTEKASDAVSVSVGNGHYAFMKEDNSLWMWGMNRFGQCGSGQNNNTSDWFYNEPLKVLDNISGFNMYSRTSVAIKDGFLWAWGENLSSIYGIEEYDNSPLPIRTVPVAEGVLIEGEDKVEVDESITLTATYYDIMGIEHTDGIVFNCNDYNAVGVEIQGNKITLTGKNAGIVTIKAAHSASGKFSEKEVIVNGGFAFNVAEDMPYYTYVGYNLLSRVQDIPASNASFEGMGIYVSDEYDASDLNIYSSNDDVFVVTGYRQDGDYVRISVMGKDKGEAMIVAECPDGTTVTRKVIVDYVNEIEFEATYDTFYRYSNGVMFGSNDKMSITAPILIRMKNKVNQFFYNAGSEFSDFLTIDDLEIEVTIDSPNLSFSKDSYSNKTVIELTDDTPLEPEKTLADLVLLFPYNVGEDTFKSLSHYTLTFNFKSEKIKETSVDIVVSVIRLDSVLAYEHIEFINNNSFYYALKAEDPAESMIELKSDPRYVWTSITSTVSGEVLTFDNPYEIMMADVILTYTTTPDKGQTCMGEICSQFKSSYDYFVNALDLYLNDSYAGVVKITEPDIIKVMEAAKNNYNSAEFINRYKYSKIDEIVHSAAGKTKVTNILKVAGVGADILEIATMGAKVYNNVMDCLNMASALKAYNYLDEHSRNVFREIASSIDDNDKLRDAMMRYVNSEADSEAYQKEMIEICDTMFGKSAIEIFNVTLGVYARETVWKYLEGLIVKKSGEAAVLAATKTGEIIYSNLSSAVGGVAAGVMLGLEVSDILCNNTQYADDSRRIIVCAEFSPHIKKALEKYETRLMLDLTEESIANFEAAFELYKALQNQSIKYTKTALEHSWDSIIAKIFNKKGDYIGVYNDLSYRQSRIEGLICHTNSKVGNVSTTVRKTLMFKCPVDVYLYDEQGNLVASIVDEVPESYDVAVGATVIQNAKYFHVPTGVAYKAVVEAREAGNMNCSFAEGDSEQENSRVNYNNLSLIKGQQYVVDISGDTELSYTVSREGDVIVPDDIFGDGEIQKVTVNVITDGEGTVVAPEIASVGEFIIVMAIPAEGKSFLGWYNGTTLVSSSQKYGFIVDSDVNLTAKFGDYTPADINGDGTVSNRDASRLMQYLAGWDVDVVEAALDVTGDGTVNNRDASRILQHVAGWDVELH